METKVKVIMGLSALLLLSCDEYVIPPHFANDYFPLKENTVRRFLNKDVYPHNHWNYLRGEISIEDTDVLSSDTIEQTIHGDTTIDGRTYKKLNSAYPQIILTTMVRREGSKYFTRNPASSSMQEYKFLDTAVPIGGTWEEIFINGYFKAEYKIKSANTSKSVNGIVYKDVIAVEVNYYFKNSDSGPFTFSHSWQHYYAKGFGEIYSYQASPYGLRITTLLTM